MPVEQYPEFRLGDVLATSFTATLTERCGVAVERIPVPSRLMDWFEVSGLTVKNCTQLQLDYVHRLRESIHAAATSIANGAPPPLSAVQILNASSAGGRAWPILAPEGVRRWQLASGSVEDALSVIAGDAVGIVSGERDGRIALCASPTCQAAFFDTSRSRTRRWCDMNTCGNREKKARFFANKHRSANPTE
ncbi:CGNR zinc finger domain-containing protein [Rhodococcus sp. H29-C3]|uniref:CGNR zinc finger domain-containing protein n=1 Tax=Rhodococcus sp. H29-C3 TaxID=3046307 RepID=UPI0024BAB109|nr:CGNR zinc finger domain-containing protein [Rhodococcus sp. H29-C3]MDJ0363464.1 CGNR zinc finger domain-containing protein [Rhodococcus sp. H29-C3]